MSMNVTSNTQHRCTGPPAAVTLQADSNFVSVYRRTCQQLQNKQLLETFFGFSAFDWIITFCSFGKIVIFLVCIVASLKWSCGNCC
jgi:hypothetical protein